MKNNTISVIGMLLIGVLAVCHPVNAESAADGQGVYYPFESFRLIGLFGEQCIHMEKLRDDLFKKEFIDRWQLFDHSADANRIFRDCLMDVKVTQSRIAAMKSLAQQGEWESINTFFYETGLMLTKSTAVLSCMTGGVPNFSTCFNLPLDIYLLGGDFKEARRAEKALDAIDKVLQNFQNILQKNENNNFSLAPYRVSVLKREFEEICRAIDQECIKVSEPSSEAPASAPGDPWVP